ncbi:MAG: hypothetical protein FD173_137 [Gallionellaceae bacterium]|nr:MAG: hypothetical protein FD173_137 [Gallionellaceae bacterium]
MLPNLSKLKPNFLPQWLFWLLLVSGGVVALCVVVIGLWVVFTQVDFM